MEHPENSGEYKGLAVNKGIEQPSSVNPYLKRKPKKRQLSVAEFVDEPLDDTDTEAFFAACTELAFVLPDVVLLFEVLLLDVDADSFPIVVCAACFCASFAACSA